MNRNEEYDALLEELRETPSALVYTVQRAKARHKRNRRLTRCLGIPVGSVAVFFVSFILLVNLLPTFARACGGVPVLRELALAVAWSPSLSAAVENDYVQSVDLEQTENDITARIEYVIVDQKQLNVFYTLNSQRYPKLEVCRTNIHDLEGFSLSASNLHLENGALSQFTLNFVEGTMPDQLTFTIQVNQWESDEGAIFPLTYDASGEEGIFYEEPEPVPKLLAEFTFTLHFDPWYTAQGETLAIDRDFTVDGQVLTLVSAESFPTNLRLTIANHEENTAWLTGLDFYLENERGERIDGVGNGISATGDMQTNGEVTYYMESDFFSRSEELTLYIYRATWLDERQERILVNLEQGTAEELPENIKLLETKQFDTGWTMTFAAKCLKENHMYNIVQKLWDELGNPIQRDGVVSSTNALDGQEGWFSEVIPIRDYDGTKVYISPRYTSVTEVATPIAVPIK